MPEGLASIRYACASVVNASASRIPRLALSWDEGRIPGSARRSHDQTQSKPLPVVRARVVSARTRPQRSLPELQLGQRRLYAVRAGRRRASSAGCRVGDAQRLGFDTAWGLGCADGVAARTAVASSIGARADSGCARCRWVGWLLYVRGYRWRAANRTRVDAAKGRCAAAAAAANSASATADRDDGCEDDDHADAEVTAGVAGCAATGAGSSEWSALL